MWSLENGRLSRNIVHEMFVCLIFLLSHVGLRERGDKEASALIVFVYVLSCLLHANRHTFLIFVLV